MVVTFEYFDAGKDWWWGIVNLEIRAKQFGSVGISLRGNQLVILLEANLLKTIDEVT